MTTNEQVLNALLDIYDGYTTARWNFPAAVGTPRSSPGGIGQGVSLTYTFLSSLPSSYSSLGITDFQPLDTAQKAAARAAFAHFSDVSGLSFSESAAIGTGNITLGQYLNGFPAGAAGWSYGPSYSYRYDSSDIIISTAESGIHSTWIRSGQADSTFVPGQQGMMLLLHEIGHAVGLKHPFSGATTLPASLDHNGFTVMSYTDAPHAVDITVTGTASSWRWVASYVAPQTLMVGDMLALQYLYGANDQFHGGNDSYRWQSGEKFFETIWDTGGTDTLDCSNQTLACVINLQPASYSSVGLRQTHAELYQDIPSFVQDSVASKFSDSELYSGENNLGIAYGCWIENAVGGSANDLITGNGLNNSLDGSSGLDTAVYTNSRASYGISRTAAGYTVKDNASTDGTDALANIERLKFADKKVALDLSSTGNAGKTLEFIGTLAFGMVRDASLVGTVLSYVDQGAGLHDLFQIVLDAGVVRQLAGSDSNTDLVKLAYRNVVGTEATTEVAGSLANTYLQGSGGSYSKADFLTAVAGLEMNQNHVDLVGLAQTGVDYL